MRRLLLLSLLLLFPFTLTAQTPDTTHNGKALPWHWDVESKVYGSIYTGALILDIGMTHYAQEHGGEELNPLLGKHPSRAKINLVGAASEATAIGIASLLPKQKRRVFLTLVAFGETVFGPLSGWYNHTPFHLEF